MVHAAGTDLPFFLLFAIFSFSKGRALLFGDKVAEMVVRAKETRTVKAESQTKATAAAKAKATLTSYSSCSTL